MQDGPRYLTSSDINTVTAYTPLTPGSSAGSPTTPGSDADPSQFGQVGQTGDGRFFRLVLVGGTSTVAAGSLLIAPAQASNTTGLAIPSTQPSNTATGSGPTPVSALAVGSRAFNVTNGSTSVTADEFAGGYVVVETATKPVSLKVSGNTAAGNAGTITVYLRDALTVALTAGTDTVTLNKNPFANVIPSATLGRPVGIVPVSVPNTSTQQYLAWVQTQGDCAGVAGAAVTAFQPVTQNTTNTGTVSNAAATTDYVIGQATRAANSAAEVNVKLAII
jgi:hypothetical protein